MTPAIAALLSIVSALAGLVVGHLLTERRARRGELAVLRLKAYCDFLAAVSRIAAARRTGITSTALEDLAALNDAKARVCVCGDAKVVEALAEFWEAGVTLEREPGIVSFSRLCMLMRESLGLLHREIAHLRFSDILFNLEPSEYSYRVAHPDNYREAKERRDAAQ